jgi:hypothetical protein
VLDPLLGAVQRLPQAGLLDRLQQVIDRVHLEGADRVLVVGGDERDKRHLGFLEHAHDPDAIQFGHLQVQEREIRPLALDRFDRLFAGFRCGDDQHILERTKQRGQKRPRRPLIVRDDDPQACVHEALRVADRAAIVKSAGNRISTVVPTPTSLTIDSVAAAPYR